MSAGVDSNSYADSFLQKLKALGMNAEGIKSEDIDYCF